MESPRAAFTVAGEKPLADTVTPTRLALGNGLVLPPPHPARRAMAAPASTSLSMRSSRRDDPAAPRRRSPVNRPPIRTTNYPIGKADREPGASCALPARYVVAGAYPPRQGARGLAEQVASPGVPALRGHERQLAIGTPDRASPRRREIEAKQNGSRRRE